MRLEEVPHLKKQYEEHLVIDKEFWEAEEEKRVSSQDHKQITCTSINNSRFTASDCLEN
jgi:hypothetical protein